MLLVHMDTDHRLIPRQMLLGKFCGNLQGLLRRDLPWLEGLDDVVILHTVLFAHSPLGVQHLPALPAWVTVEVGGEDSFLGLVPIEDVVDAHIQAAFPRQYFCDGHGNLQKTKCGPFRVRPLHNLCLIRRLSIVRQPHTLSDFHFRENRHER